MKRPLQTKSNLIHYLLFGTEPVLGPYTVSFLVPARSIDNVVLITFTVKSAYSTATSMC